MTAVQTTSTPGLASQSGGLAGSIWGAQRNAPSGIAGLVGNTGAFGAYKPIFANMSTPNGVAIGSAPNTPNMSLLSGPMSTPNAPKTQDVKKVISNPDKTQEVHYYPSSSSGSQPTQSTQGGVLTAPGYNASNLPPGATQSVVSQNPPVNQTGQGTFTTPNGAIVDAQGNIIKQSPMVASPTTDTGAPSFPGLVNLGAQAAQQSTTIGQNAANIATDYAKQIKDAGIQAALSQEGLLTTGGPSAPLQGNALAQANLGAAREQALGTAESAALAGTSQQLTAQDQASKGLLSAAGQVAPSQNFPFVFNPATGTFSAPGVGGTAGTATGGTTLTYNPQTDASNMAKAVIGGSMTYQQALDSLGYQGNIASGNLNSAITAAGGNPLVLQAQGPAQQQAVGNYAGVLEPAFQASQGVKNTLDQFISDNPTLNTAQLTAGNAIQQWLQGKQLGDPNVQTFLNDVSEYVQTLAPILGVGGTPTDAKAYVASQFVNAQASGQSVQQVLSNIETLAKNKLDYYKAGATGTQPSKITPQTSTNTTSSTGTGGYAETW